MDYHTPAVRQPQEVVIYSNPPVPYLQAASIATANSIPCLLRSAYDRLDGNPKPEAFIPLHPNA